MSNTHPVSRRSPGAGVKRLLQTALVLGLAFVLAAALWIWLKQESLLFQPIPLPVSVALINEPYVSEDAIEVPGARLSALHLRLPDPKGVVFFLHGNGGNLQNWFVNTEFYRRAGFDLFMLDYRGYGKSTGQIESEAQLRADVRAAWSRMAPQYAGKKIVIYGRSLGTALAAGLTAELAATAGAQQPDLTVLVSPYSSMVALTAEYYPLVPPFLLRYPLRTDEAVARIRSPLLLFHGDRDTLIAPRHSEVLKALAPQAQLVRVPGAAHNDVHQFDSYLNALIGALAALK